MLAACPALLLAVQVHFAASGIVYTLDDPYIHLTLARQIWHGHYGINPSAFAAPSSSILWPFLLAPLGFTRLVELLPLAINLVSLVVTLWWIERWFETYASPLWALLATILVAFCFNLYGLPFSGMEHSLQVMLVVVMALSLVHGRTDWPLWLSLIVLPFIRYEGLALSLPAALYLALTPAHRLKAAASALVITLGVGGFSLFLYSHGAGLLPAAVIVRDGLHGGLGPLSDFGRMIDSVQSQFYFVAIAAFAGVLLVRENKAMAALLLLGAPTVGHVIFGRYGDLSRYQIYFEIWVAIHFLAAYLRSGLTRRLALNALLAAGLAASTTDAMLATLTAPTASRNVGDQSRQMALIARDYLDEPVAVHDLGLVSFYARRYVLDLAGLASVEVLRLQAEADAALWVPALMDRHQVEHAMIYANFFDRPPTHWIHVADLNLPLPCLTPGSSDRVLFYSTSPAAAVRLRAALSAYRASSRDRAMMLALTVQPVGGQQMVHPASTKDACDFHAAALHRSVLGQMIVQTPNKARIALDALLASRATPVP